MHATLSRARFHATGVTLVALATLAFAAPTSAGSPLKPALALGADYLTRIQGTYPGQTRINPGPPGPVVSVGAIANVWEFDIGSGQAFFNTWGATALGLAAAAAAVKDDAAADSVTNYAYDLVADFHDVGAFDRSQTRPMNGDLELLGRLAGARPCRAPRMPGSASSAGFAETASDWLLNHLAAVAEADRIINGRIGQGNGDLAGWDVALLVRGALLAGDAAYACAAAERVMDRRADWEGSSPAFISDYWHGISEGGLAYALSMMNASGAPCRDFSADIRGYRDQILARLSGPDLSPFTGIDNDGAVLVDYSGTLYGPTQHAAFAILGLLGCDKAPKTDERAAARIAGFLLRSQYPEGTPLRLMTPAFDPRPPDGGWPGFPYYFQDDSNAEVNGEILFALAVALDRSVAIHLRALAPAPVLAGPPKSAVAPRPPRALDLRDAGALENDPSGDRPSRLRAR